MKGAGEKIRVLIVDDSSVVADLLEGVLDSDPEVEVIGRARNGRVGVEMCATLRPDVVTMDIRMPVMDGFEATEIIMSECPTPILVLSASLDEEELDICFNAIRAGAMDVVEKPRNCFSREYVALSRELIGRIKLVSRIRPIRRHRRFQEHLRRQRRRARTAGGEEGRRILAVGASTGGPAALSRLFGALPGDFPWPVLAVQHIAPGFLDGFAQWLGTQTPLRVCMAQPGERPRPGSIYLPTEGCHLGVDPGGRLTLDPSGPVEGHRPSVSYLFRTVARAHGSRAVGVLLTGMGRDGAQGLLEMRREGALTLAQDEGTSLIYGMPAAAVELGAASLELPLDGITARILREAAPTGDRAAEVPAS